MNTSQQVYFPQLPTLPREITISASSIKIVETLLYFYFAEFQNQLFRIQYSEFLISLGIKYIELRIRLRLREINIQRNMSKVCNSMKAFSNK